MADPIGRPVGDCIAVGPPRLSPGRWYAVQPVRFGRIRRCWIDGGFRMLQRSGSPTAVAFAHRPKAEMSKTMPTDIPSDPTPLLQRAAQALQRGDLATAERSCRAALKAAPHHPGALHLLGVVARRAGYVDAAIDLFQQAVAKAPDYALADQNKTAEAQRAYAAGLKARPDYWPAQSGLAQMLVKAGDVDGAIAALDSAVAHHRGQSAPALELGNLLQTQGRHQEAIRAYSAALDREPGLTPGLSNRAAARLKCGDPAGALADAEAYLATGAKSANVVAYKVLALQLLGRQEAAQQLADIDTMVYPVRPSADPSFAARLEADIRAHPKLIDDWDPTLRAARHGQVVQDLTKDPTPTIAAFLQMIGDAVENLKASLPDQPGHPFFGAKPSRYQMIVWANILGAGGHQAAHIHNYGWVSGVFYPSLPDDISDASPAGWISFGTPGYGLPARPDLPTRALRPRPGGMFLFPSYIWHHTIPLETGAERVSIAFDIVPR